MCTASTGTSWDWPLRLLAGSDPPHTIHRPTGHMPAAATIRIESKKTCLLINKSTPPPKTSHCLSLRLKSRSASDPFHSGGPYSRHGPAIDLAGAPRSTSLKIEIRQSPEFKSFH